MTTTKTKPTGKAGKMAKGFALPKAQAHAEVKPEAAKRFEEAKAPAPKSSNTRKKRVLPEGVKNADAFSRVTAYVPNELMTTIRVKCATENVSYSEVITNLLTQWATATK